MEINLHHILAMLILIIMGSYFFIQPSPIHDSTDTEILRIGVLPDEEKENLRERYKPLLDHLSTRTDINCQLVVPDSYAELVQLFSDNKIDLAHFGGLTFIQVNTFYDAQPLVMRDIDTHFTSFFLAKKNQNDFSFFENKIFSFGSKLSTSGHLMPRHFLQTEQQIDPENYFSNIIFSGAHDKTAYLVRDGKVDLGVANSEVIRQMFNDGRLQENDLHIIWETPPYANYVWVANKHLNEKTKTQLLDAFLELDLNTPHHKTILKSLGARIFLPASVKDFSLLKKKAQDLNLLEMKKK